MHQLPNYRVGCIIERSHWWVVDQFIDKSVWSIVRVIMSENDQVALVGRRLLRDQQNNAVGALTRMCELKNDEEYDAYRAWPGSIQRRAGNHRVAVMLGNVDLFFWQQPGEDLGIQALERGTELPTRKGRKRWIRRSLARIVRERWRVILDCQNIVYMVFEVVDDESDGEPSAGLRDPGGNTSTTYNMLCMMSPGRMLVTGERIQQAVC